MKESKRLLSRIRGDTYDIEDIIIGLKQELEGAELRLNDTDDDLTRALHDMENVQFELKQAEDYIDELDKELGLVQGRIKELRQRLEARDHVHDDLERCHERLAELKDEANALRQENDHLADDAAKAAERADRHFRGRLEQDRRYQSCIDRAELAEEALAEAQERIDNLEDRLEDLGHDQVQDLENLVAEREAELERVYETLANVRRERDEQIRRADRYSIENRQLRTFNGDLLDQRDESERQLEPLRKRIDILEGDLIEARRPLRDLDLPEGLYSRLYNWKFESAENYIDGSIPDEAALLIEALSAAFGNSGWFSGHLAEIVNHALQNIGIDPDTEWI